MEKMMDGVRQEMDYNMEEMHDTVDLEWGENSNGNIGGRTLIGKVISSKALNKKTVMAMIRKGWNMGEGLSIIEAQDNMFVFNFEKEEECKRILKGRPWAILDGLSRRNLEKLGRKVGEVVMVEEPVLNGRILRTFARARILQYYFKCGMVGHESRGCKIYSGEDEGRKVDRKLGTMSVRTWEDAVVYVREDWKEIEEWSNTKINDKNKVGMEDRRYVGKENVDNNVKMPYVSSGGNEFDKMEEDRRQGDINVGREVVFPDNTVKMDKGKRVMEEKKGVNEHEMRRVLKERSGKGIKISGVGDSNDGMIEGSSSRQRYIVELPSDEDIVGSKAILPFVNSPQLVEVMVKMEEVIFKRAGEELEDTRCLKIVKKEDVKEYVSEPVLPFVPGVVGNGLSKKMKVKKLSKKSRIGMNLIKEWSEWGELVDIPIAVGMEMNGEVFEFKAGVEVGNAMDENECGSGGYPNTATKGP
ncbi:TMV resistance protein N-like [Senna tora]|uniref:TMV resistance protein N-like n=1 Tax=Senna tora TaxID=362788 RepID=A0A834WZA4_9FABA|nr:TMV resistance protein N-like [Senna tora]